MMITSSTANDRTLPGMGRQIGYLDICVVRCFIASSRPCCCLAPPFLHTFFPLKKHMHRALAISVILFGATALISGFRRHRRILVPMLVAAGLGCVAGGAWFGDRLPSHAVEIAITSCGSALMITAHRLNHTFCRSCACASHCGY